MDILELRDKIINCKKRYFIRNYDISENLTISKLVNETFSKQINQKEWLELAKKLVDMKYGKLGNTLYKFNYSISNNGINFDKIIICTENDDGGIYITSYKDMTISEMSKTKYIELNEISPIDEKEYNFFYDNIFSDGWLYFGKYFDAPIIEHISPPKFISNGTFVLTDETKNLTINEYKDLIKKINGETKKEVEANIEILKKKYIGKYIVHQYNDNSIIIKHVTNIKLIDCHILFSHDNELIINRLTNCVSYYEFGYEEPIKSILYIFDENETLNLEKYIERLKNIKI